MCIKTSMPITIYSIFLGTRNKELNELNGEIIEEFVDLRAKMYSLKTKKEEMKKAKKVKKNIVKKTLAIKTA